MHLSTAAKKQLKQVFFFTCLFGLLAHAYRFCNPLFNHDSLQIYIGNDIAWQLSLGRFMHLPYWRFVRGYLNAPVLVGAFFLLFFSLANGLIVAMLRLKKTSHIALVCGILVTSPIMSLVSASYLHELDIYALAFLLSCLTVYVWQKHRFGFLLSILILPCSTGLYQSFLGCTVALFLIVLMRDAIQNVPFSKVFTQGIKALVILVVGLLVYSLVVDWSLQVGNVSLSTQYNSISTVGDYSNVSIVSLLGDAYMSTYNYLTHPITYQSEYVALLNQGLMVFVVIASIFAMWKNKTTKPNIVLFVLCLGLLPLGMASVYVISKGMVHDLMKFPFECFYLLVFACLSFPFICKQDALINKLLKWASIAVAIVVSVVIVKNITIANQMYLKKELEEQATASLMTRLIDRIELTEGYQVGETTVVIVGEWGSNDLTTSATKREGFTHYFATGLEANTSIVYPLTMQWYFDYVLAYPINLTIDTNTVATYGYLPEVQAMPSFPSIGCTLMVDDVLVVKLAEYP